MHIHMQSVLEVLVPLRIPLLCKPNIFPAYRSLAIPFEPILIPRLGFSESQRREAGAAAQATERRGEPRRALGAYIGRGVQWCRQ